MSKYSNASIERLNSARSDLKRVFAFLITYFDHSILCGYRDKKDQNKAFKSKFSKLKYPQSKHNKIPSEGIDALPWDGEEKKVHWITKNDLVKMVKENSRDEFLGTLEDLLQIYMFAGMVKAAGWKDGVDVRWGGDWDGDFKLLDQSFDDLAHYEVIGTE